MKAMHDPSQLFLLGTSEAFTTSADEIFLRKTG